MESDLDSADPPPKSSPHSSSSSQQRIQFVSGLHKSKSSKVLILDGFKYHCNRKYDQDTYFKCAFTKKTGCLASVIVHNLNHDDYSFDDFTIKTEEHLNHTPDGVVEENIYARIAKVKVHKVESPNTEMLDPEMLRNCKHICLFCFATLPPGYNDTACIENVVPQRTLSISLDDPVKNALAFEGLCSRLGVKWRKHREGLNFNESGSLPLCFKCQNVYQDMAQLNLQIRELEQLVSKYVKKIRRTIENAEAQTKTEFAVVGTPLTLLGLDVFRKKVICGGLKGRGDRPRLEARRFRPEKKFDAKLETSSHKKPEEPNINAFLDDINDIIKEEIDIPEESGGGDEEALRDTWMNSKDPLQEDDLNPSLSADMDTSMDINDSGGDDNEGMSNQNSESDESEEIISKPQTRSRRQCVNKTDSNVDDYDPSSEEDDESESDQDESGENDEEIDDDDDDDYSTDDGDSDYDVKRSSKSKSRPSSKAGTRRTRNKYRRTGPVTKNYTCHICSTVVMGYTEFMQHYEIDHPDEERYTCKFCQRHFQDLRDCVIHQRRHTGERPFKCSQCPADFTCQKTLKSHIYNKHTDRTDVVFTCPEPDCDKEFSSKFILNNHLAAVHDYTPQHNFYKKSGQPVRCMICHLCDKALWGRGPFLQHYVDQHPEENRYTCKFCQKYFRDLRDCVKHQRKHTGEAPYPCLICNKAFRDAKSLRVHQTNRHSDQPLTHECPECPRKFATKNLLTMHMNCHNVFVVFCKSCGSNFKSKHAFSKHNKKLHDGQAERSEPLINPTPEMLKSVGITEFPMRAKCHICWEPVSSRFFLQKHFDDNHPDHQGGLKTCQCGKQFKEYKECVKHAIRHSKHKTFQCEQCPQTFFTSTELRVHISRHAPLEQRKTCVCDICGIAVVSPEALQRHKRRHETNQTRFVCETCGKSYAEKKGLYHHTRAEHLKILPHKCTYCERAFALNADLSKHLRSHTGQKPYKCPHCDKCFPYSSSKARHIREVHNLTEGNNTTPRNRKKKRSNTAKQEDHVRREILDMIGGGGAEEGVSTSSTFESAASYRPMDQYAAGVPLSYTLLGHQDYSAGGSSMDSNHSTSGVDVKPDHDSQLPNEHAKPN